MSALAERPAASEYAPFYAKYVERVPEGSVVDTLASQLEATTLLFSGLGDERAAMPLAPGKWSAKQTLGHLADTERIFAYRALRIARGDATPLPGYDHDAYVLAGGFDTRSLDDLLDEWRTLRAANAALFRGFAPDALRQMGDANGNPLSARAAVWVIAGHELHHRALLAERLGG